MKNRIISYCIIIFSIVFLVRVITIFTADRLYSMSLAVEQGKRKSELAITMLNIASTLDSTNADLYFLKYEILRGENASNAQKQQLNLLKKCTDLCPSWPAYHLYYVLTLIQMSPQPNIITKERILSELKKAKELKPYSLVYMNLYQKYSKRYK